jgi:hypothetical protein
MSDAQILNYVKASALALGFELDDARLERVATHLARTAALAKSLESLPLDVVDEPAEVYCPQAFRAASERRAP